MYEQYALVTVVQRVLLSHVDIRGADLAVVACLVCYWHKAYVRTILTLMYAMYKQRSYNMTVVLVQQSNLQVVFGIEVYTYQ
jgi:hypothetical protein